MEEWLKKKLIAKKCIKPIIEESEITKQSGIYLYEREDEKGIHYFYCGLASNIFERQISHWMGYQRIDISMRKRKFYNSKNPYGWKFKILQYCKKEELEKLEQEWILFYLKKGYQTYNLNYGGNLGKSNIFDKGQGGYKKGVKFGYEKARKEIVLLFTKYLKFDVKKDNVLSQRAKEKFEKFLKGASENGNRN